MQKNQFSQDKIITRIITTIFTQIKMFSLKMNNSDDDKIKQRFVAMITWYDVMQKKECDEKKNKS